MENETKELIEQLATKLGTTTEYLWGVLIKQAPIYAMNSTLEIIAIIIMGILLWKTHKKLSIEDDNGRSLYYKYGELAGIPMIVAAIIWGIFFICAFFTFSNIITAIANPEYWALMKIMDNC